MMRSALKKNKLKGGYGVFFVCLLGEHGFWGFWGGVFWIFLVAFF